MRYQRILKRAPLSWFPILSSCPSALFTFPPHEPFRWQENTVREMPEYSFVTQLSQLWP